jgi:hypothetical protein
MAEEKKKGKNDLPTTKKDDNILELIRLIDSNKNKLFKWYDAFYGLGSFLFVIVILYVFTEPILLSNTASPIENAVLILSLIAVVAALFSLALPTVKEDIVSANFRRLKSKVKNEEEPLLKSLIELKVKNLKFDLEQIYNMHKKMFTKEKLLEKLYE